ncbi:MAG: heme-binding beta-barrel domain-containing protein [Candidatus Dormibacteria bacterium]
MSTPPLHPDCAPLSFLLGRWEGEGRGLWTADPPFTYREEVVIDHAGKPFLRYAQRTWRGDGGTPLHSEVGYLRPVGVSGVELLVVQPTGIVEIHAGHLAAGALELETVLVGVSPTAKPVTAVRRRIWVDGGGLGYRLRLAINGEPLADHLEASLRRVEAKPDAGSQVGR